MLQYALPGHIKSSNFVHTSFNWLIGVICKSWWIVIKTLSWLSDNKQRTEPVNHYENYIYAYMWYFLGLKQGDLQFLEGR